MDTVLMEPEKDFIPNRDAIHILGHQSMVRLHVYPKRLLKTAAERLGSSVGTLECVIKDMLPMDVYDRYRLDAGPWRMLCFLSVVIAIHYNVSPISVVWHWQANYPRAGTDPRNGEVLTDLKGYCQLFNRLDLITGPTFPEGLNLNITGE